MTSECYDTKCPFHSCHTSPDDGPFCYEVGCIESLEYCNDQELIDFYRSFRKQVKRFTIKQVCEAQGAFLSALTGRMEKLL